jgi:hypothetical protein
MKATKCSEVTDMICTETQRKSKGGMLGNGRLVIGASLLVAALALCPRGASAQVSEFVPVDGASNHQGANSLPDAPSMVSEVASFPLVLSSGLMESDEHQAGSSSGRSEGLLSRNAEARFLQFQERANSPDVLAGTFLDAIQAQLQHVWPGYGSGLQGFAKRYGALLADRDASSFFGTFLFPSLLHQDPRYFRLGPASSIWHRTAYAISRTVLTRNDAGGTTFNSSLLFSVVASQSLKNLYYPEQQRGFAVTLQRSGNALLGNMQDNLSREFLPDVEAFLWKHVPARLKRLERRMPLRRVWEPAAFAEDLAGF